MCTFEAAFAALCIKCKDLKIRSLADLMEATKDANHSVVLAINQWGGGHAIIVDEFKRNYQNGKLYAAIRNPGIETVEHWLLAEELAAQMYDYRKATGKSFNLASQVDLTN